MHLCNTEDIPDREARSFSTPLGELIVAQRDGMFYAYKNICPHLGINLEYMDQQFMDIEQEYLLCSNHGALFQVHNGLCVYGPCSGQSLQSIAIEIHSDGGIYLIEPH